MQYFTEMARIYAAGMLTQRGCIVQVCRCAWESIYAGVCLVRCAREWRNTTFVMGNMRGSAEIYRGMSDPLLAGVEKYAIRDGHYAWE